MEEIKYDTLFIGFVSMVSFHNFVKSILLYCSGRDKSLSFLKIIFNISSFICSITSLLFFMIINLSCEMYMRVNYKVDMWINIVLLVTRAAFNVSLITYH
ncbi:hypothetical protein GLOIN_2v1574094 [Rhizophagus irregularis DAOM 181602=DAOM 197198]|uniref:Uncharacterized protein n=1 Tax=Rhizophagus irregularis (strain DAOM 181602 / DAOM 197198 / MUCL 43194) TaxID=747089 RepID=A0A2P4QA40_RHIID|nr:hypothetical protein GLOIN_2v1574094 [Rhizophagus irregularis DAOM 181602=DAOM 197198]POG74505.1 hypothetical protein GLOIN_2v1574094 [Rhizophagus irregularis DAOM 181602=DAOM 197198]|eukprot:XP_025181371.1 hypothetical protein GLOIN_2v1574094 [Rhizophagus irregularis DAOM 181602=DAOM 197198]